LPVESAKALMAKRILVIIALITGVPSSRVAEEAANNKEGRGIEERDLYTSLLISHSYYAVVGRVSPADKHRNAPSWFQQCLVIAA
jgi:hypothetical protein